MTELSRRIPKSGLLPFLWLLVFLVAPIAVVVVYSFAQKGPYGGIVWEFTFDNYLLATEPVYLSILVKSLRFALVSTAGCLFFGFPLAYVIARSSRQMRSLLLFLVIVPFITNFVVRSFALKGLLGMQGPLNTLLLSLGLTNEPISFLNSNLSILIGMISNYLPFMVLPLYVALEKFDYSLIEASRDLGASAVQSFLNVLMPLSVRGVLTGSMLVFIPSLGEFVIPEIFGGGRSMFVGTLITDQFLKTRDWPFGSALSMILFIILGVGIFFQNRANRTLGVTK